MSESKTTKLAPTVRLSDGTQMPVIGLGTCLQSAGRVEDAVLDAIDAGYRLIDTALIYGTEGDVGSAVRTKIAQGLVKREDMYIITKLWNNSHRPDVVESTCRKSLANLGMDYVDLYLMHWPIAFEDGDNLMPMSDDGKVLFSDIDYVETYRAMEKLVEKGLTRSIGLSNFNSVQMQRILDNCTIKPVVNEVECHPYLNQSKLISLCLLHGIQVVAYSPFGSPGSPWSEGQDKLFEDETIIGLARNYNKTCGQIILRFLVQSKAIPIPKSVTTGRIQENFNIFDFELTDKDMATLGLLNKNKRLCTFPQISGHAEYPFVIEF